MNALIATFSLLAVLALPVGAAEDAKPPATTKPIPMIKTPENTETITLGAGCFWCTEAVFQQIPGVLSVTSGYSNGNTRNPNYEQVCTGDTGHAEVTRVIFDPKQTSLEKILAVFWHAHDPTTLNRQGGDTGTQYRSGIFYLTEAQRAVAEKSKAAAQKEFSSPIVTEITKAGEFYAAENYHQDYYRLNKGKNPYCRLVIAPKLKKLGLHE